MKYWENPEYWKKFQYDRARGCVCYGDPNQYSWGWVVDDFGNHVMPQNQITGWGMHDAHIDHH